MLQEASTLLAGSIRQQPELGNSKHIHRYTDNFDTSLPQYRETRFAPELKAPRVALGGVTPSLFARWTPILAVWGVGAGAAVMLFASDM